MPQPHDNIWDAAEWLLSSSDVRLIVDGGANRGDTSADFRSRYPAAEIVAFEPIASLHRGLEERFASDDKVRVVNAALGAAHGSAKLHIAGHDSASSLFPREAVQRRYFHSSLGMVGSEVVEVTTLDAQLKSMGRIHLLKLDLQGSELAALQGAVGLLSRGEIDVIVTEFFCVPHYEGAPLLNDIWAYLRGFGYDIYNMWMAAHGSNGQARWGDAIFVSSGFRARVLDTQPDEP